MATKVKTRTPSVLRLGIDYEDAEIGITFIRHFARLRNNFDGIYGDESPQMPKDFARAKDVAARDLWWPEIKAYRDLPADAIRFVSYCGSALKEARENKRMISWVEVAEREFRTICESEGREVPMYLRHVNPKPEEARRLRRMAQRHTWWYPLLHEDEQEEKVAI